MQRAALFAVVPLVLVSAVQAVPPAQALKYHEALLKRPNNEALFERFFGAWLDEQPQESLEAFLTDRAKEHGGQEWAILARYQLRRGQEEAALDSFGKAMAAVPDDPGLAMERGKLRLRRLDFAGAREDLAKVAAGKDETLSLEAGKLVGKAWLRQGNSEEAVKAWDALLAAHAADEDLLEDLVETAASEGAMAQALGYADKLIAATKDPYQKAVRGMRKGDLLAKAGRNDDALAAYSATLKEVGEGSWLEHELLAQVEKIFRKQDRLDDLKKELAKLAEGYPRRLLIQRQLAKLEAAQGGMDSAIGRFREVLKRSPGDKELQEEFVRLLVDGERFDDAAVEIQRLIGATPGDSGLWLQLAAVRFRLQKPDDVLEALKKAHALLGTDVPSGIRIAGLMMQYGLGDQAETLLKQLAATPGGGTAAQEALASYYGRSQRKADAVALLKQVAASDDEDTVLRAAGAVAGLGENGEAFQMLAARMNPFGGDARFLSALGQSSLAAGKAEDAVAPVLKLVRMAKQPAELGEAVALAARVIRATGKIDEWRETLTKQAPRSVPETCLLAALHEAQGDPVSGAELLKPSTDPMAIRFLAAMLDKRGEFDDAITALSKLAGTEEGRKAGYFKELSELQQRGGKNAEALATVERWRQIAPGDKAAWIASSRLLKETGKPDQAVKIARQAVSKFEGDADLTAGLATLQEDASQWTEAESIYWRLYDEAANASDQARWAGQLARLAGKTGRLPELEEKLQERARGNRRSLGPILAQAELQRVIGDEDKRRDLIAEAVRLQPKDVDLRLQLSTLEEQAGNPDRALAVLEEVVPADPSGKARGALAQAYIRQGQALKGLRELKQLAGKSRDPRAVETSAISLADAKLFEEAITFIQEESGEAGDWRLSYLLGTLLEEDGRDQEAVAVFLPLLEAKGDLASKPAATPPQGYRNRRGMGDSSPESEALGELVTLIGSAYAHREMPSSRSGLFNGAGSNAGFSLPADARQLHILAMVHLQNLASRVAGGEAIRAAVKGAGGADADFVNSLVVASTEGEGGIARAMAKHPDRPGVVDWVVSSGEATQEMLKSLLDHATHVDGWTKFEAGMQGMSNEGADSNASPEEDGSSWSLVFTGMKDVITSKDISKLPQMTWMMVQMAGGNGKVSEEHKTTAKELVRQSLARLSKEPHTPEIGVSALLGLNFAGSADEYVDQLNVVMRDVAKAPDNQSPMLQSRLSSLRSYIGNATESEELFKSIFAIPTLDGAPFATLPYWFGPMLAREAAKSSQGQNQEEEETEPDQTGAITLADIAKRLNRIESPVLRAWVAIKSKDSAAAAKLLDGDVPKEAARDIELLRSILALDANKPVEAYDALARMRAAVSTNADVTTWVVNAQLGVALGFSAEEQSARADDLKTLLILAQRNLGPGSGRLIASVATKLRLEEWGKRFLPPPSPAGNANASRGLLGLGRGTGSSGQRRVSPLDRVRKFVAENKHEAAAMEALRLMRGYRSQSGYSGDDDQDSLVKALGKEDLGELLKIIDPGESKSLVKRLEYASLCQDFGKGDLALAMMEKLHAERPADPVVAGRYVFLMPERDRQLRVKLLDTFAANPEFVTQLNDGMRRLEEKKNRGKVAYAFFEALGGWLGGVDPAVLAKSDLGWISYFAKEFFNGDFDPEETTSLLEETKTRPANDNGIKKWQADTGRSLALAMLRQPAIAEEGFRLLTACKAWTVSPEETDAHARTALDGLIGTRSKDYEGNGIFNGSDPFDTNGGGFEEHSSVRWLASRLTAGAPVEEVLPTAFVATLQQKNARLGGMLVSLKGMSDLAGLKREWAAGNLKPQTSLAGMMVRDALMKRATSLPGAAGFFSERLAEAFPKNVDPTKVRLPAEVDVLLSATLTAGAAGPEADRAAVAKLYAKLLFGDKVDWAKPRDPERLSRATVFTSRYFGARLDSGASSRMSHAFYRAGIPIAREAKEVTRLHGDHSFSNVSELEDHLQAIGWLDGAATWVPELSWTLALNRTGNTASVVKTRVMSNAELAEHFDGRLSGQVSPLVRKLSAPDEHRFGALMTAAAFSDGDARGRLAARAFTECAAELQKLSPDRIDEISTMLAWVPVSSREKLPPLFQERMKKANDQRLVDLRKKAEAYIASKATGPENPFDGLQPLVLEIVTVDVDLALKVFLEADRRYTASITRGGKISFMTTSDGIDLTAPDHALFELYSSQGSVFRSDIGLGLRFLNRLMASKQGGHFSCFGVLRSVGNHMFYIGTAKGLDLYQREECLLDMVAACDPDVRTLAAMAAFGDYPSHWARDLDGGYIKGMRKIAEDHRAACPEGARFASLSAGLCNLWRGKEDNQAVTMKALAEVLEDESLPIPARMTIGCQAFLRFSDLINYDEVSNPMTKVYETYCAGGRSAINPFAVELLQRFSKSDMTPNALDRARRISKAFWDNVSSKKEGGHPPIPEMLCEPLFALAADIGDDAKAKELFERARPGATGNTIIIDRLIRSRRFEMAMNLMPPPDQPLQRPARMALYSNEMEAALEALRATGADPHRMTQLDVAMLDLTPGEGPLEPVESIRARLSRLTAEMRREPPEGVVARLNSLVILCYTSRMLAWDIKEQYSECARMMPLSQMVADRNADKPVPGTAVTRKTLFSWEIYFQNNAALMEMGQGNVTLLKGVREAFRANGSTSKNDDQSLDMFYAEFLKQCALAVAVNVTRHETEGFHDAFDVFAGMALDSLAPNATVRAEKLGDVLSICHFLACWCGEPERFDGLLAQISDSRKPGIKPEDGMIKFLELAKSSTAWNAPQFMSAREGLIRGMFARPEFVVAFPPDASWTDRFEKIMEGSEFENLAAQLSPDWTAELRTPLCMYNARKMKAAKRPEDSLDWYRQALGESGNGEWAMFRNLVRIEYAETLSSLKRPDEARELLAVIRPSEMRPEWQKRYNQAVVAVGRKK